MLLSILPSVIPPPTHFPLYRSFPNIAMWVLQHSISVGHYFSIRVSKWWRDRAYSILLHLIISHSLYYYTSYFSYLSCHSLIPDHSLQRQPCPKFQHLIRMQECMFVLISSRETFILFFILLFSSSHTTLLFPNISLF